MAIIAAGFIPKLSKVLKEKTIIRVAFLSYSLAHSLFFLFNENITFIIAGVFLGIGFGFSIPLLNHITIEKSDTKTLSKNLSLYTMLIFLGQFLATFSEFFPGKLNTIFLIASLLSLALILISLIIKKKIYFDKIKICKIRNKN
jgi:MFS family permease